MVCSKLAVEAGGVNNFTNVSRNQDGHGGSLIIPPRGEAGVPEGALSRVVPEVVVLAATAGVQS